MKFNKKLFEAMNNKTKVFVNGLPSEEGALITLIEEDYIELTIFNKANKEEDNTTEIVSIPLNQIYSLSTGEVKVGGLNGFTQEKKEETPKQDTTAEEIVAAVDDEESSGDATSDTKN